MSKTCEFFELQLYMATSKSGTKPTNTIKYVKYSTSPIIQKQA